MVRAIAVSLTLTIMGGCTSTTKEALFDAVNARDVDSVQSICKRRPSAARTEDERGVTALNIAIEANQTEIARVLIEAGADIHHYSPLTGMPLSRASYLGCNEMVSLLLDAGADVNRQPERDVPIGHGTALHHAVDGVKLQTVDILLKRGADVNAKMADQYGETALHRAADNDPTSPDAVAIVQLLLARGAKINATDNDGRTPLSAAKRALGAERGNREIVELLVNHGARESREKRERKR
jgi:ankyrin repeat protein